MVKAETLRFAQSDPPRKIINSEMFRCAQSDDLIVVLDIELPL